MPISFPFALSFFWMGLFVPAGESMPFTASPFFFLVRLFIL